MNRRQQNRTNQEKNVEIQKNRNQSNEKNVRIIKQFIVNFFSAIVYFKRLKMNILKDIFLLKGLIRFIFLIKKIFILLLFRFFFSVILFATCENFFVESNSKKKSIKFNLIINRFFET